MYIKKEKIRKDGTEHHHSSNDKVYVEVNDTVKSTEKKLDVIFMNEVGFL